MLLAQRRQIPSSSMQFHQFVLTGLRDEAFGKWLLGCKQQLKDTSSALFHSLPEFVQHNIGHMSWVWEMFLDIRDIETWVNTEIQRDTPIGKALLGMQNPDTHHQEVLTMFKANVHAEMQILLYYSQRNLSTVPYIGISFLPCCHCRRMLEAIPLTVAGTPTLCRHSGCSGKVYPWISDPNYMDQSKKEMFLGKQLASQLQGLSTEGRCEWGPKLKPPASEDMPASSAQHAVSDKGHLAWWVVTEGLGSLESWFIKKNVPKPPSGSLSRRKVASYCF